MIGQRIVHGVATEAEVHVVAPDTGLLLNQQKSDKTFLLVVGMSNPWSRQLIGQAGKLTFLLTINGTKQVPVDPGPAIKALHRTVHPIGMKPCQQMVRELVRHHLVYRCHHSHHHHKRLPALYPLRLQALTRMGQYTRPLRRNFAKYLVILAK